MKDEFFTKISLMALGLISNLLILLLCYTLLAQITVEIASTLNNPVLIFIVLSLFILNMAIAVFVSTIIISDAYLKRLAYKSAILSIVIVFVVIVVISYFSLLISYPSIFSKLRGLEIVLAFPQVILLFSLYFFVNPFYLFLLTSFIYFALFIIIIEIFQRYK